MSKKINIISPFGPKLAKIKLSKKVVSDINPVSYTHLRAHETV